MIRNQGRGSWWVALRQDHDGSEVILSLHPTKSSAERAVNGPARAEMENQGFGFRVAEAYIPRIGIGIT